MIGFIIRVAVVALGLWVAAHIVPGVHVRSTGSLIAAAITEGDTRWQLFRRFGLPFAGGPIGRAPALMIYWAHQTRSQIARRMG